MNQSAEKAVLTDTLRAALGTCPACGVRPYDHPFIEPTEAEVMGGRCPYNDRLALDAALVQLARLIWDEGALAFSDGRGSDANPYWAWLEGQPRLSPARTEADRG